MSLTDEDITQVRDVVVSAIEALVLPRFDALEADMAEVKEDIRELKEDVSVLKEDVRVLKEDVRMLKTEMREVKEGLNRLDGRVEALEADIKELYRMTAEGPKRSVADQKFAKLSFDKKVLQMYEDVKLLAQEAGITLPN